MIKCKLKRGKKRGVVLRRGRLYSIVRWFGESDRWLIDNRQLSVTYTTEGMYKPIVVEGKGE